MSETDYKTDFHVVDHVVMENKMLVIVEEQKNDRRYLCTGQISIDGVVEPLNPNGYRVKQLADRAVEVAEAYVDSQTPYRMYDGKHWWHTKTLRGISFSERQEFNKLSAGELSRLAERLRCGDIELGDGDV